MPDQPRNVDLMMEPTRPRNVFRQASPQRLVERLFVCRAQTPNAGPYLETVHDECFVGVVKCHIGDSLGRPQAHAECHVVEEITPDWLHGIVVLHSRYLIAEL